MNKGQVAGTVVFFIFVSLIICILGGVGLIVFTKLGLISEILIAAIKAFGFGFVFFLLIPSLILIGLVRGTYWGFKQTWLSGHDLSTTLSAWLEKLRGKE